MADQSIYPARPAIKADGSAMRKSRTVRKHLGRKGHSRKKEHEHLAQHGLKKR